jgi:hypothetical protein
MKIVEEQQDMIVLVRGGGLVSRHGCLTSLEVFFLEDVMCRWAAQQEQTRHSKPSGRYIKKYLLTGK